MRYEDMDERLEGVYAFDDLGDPGKALAHRMSNVQDQMYHLLDATKYGEEDGNS